MKNLKTSLTDKSLKIDFLSELKSIKPPVWKIINSYLPKTEPKKHYQAVREYPERQGKYLRPALVLWSTAMHGGNRNDALLTAAAMQTSEDWLLVHDDFLDQSLERRSTKSEFRPTLNIKYGDEVAVNAGDALHVLMWKMLGDNVRQHKPEIGWMVYDKMTHILQKTLEGQFMEVDWRNMGRLNISEKEYFKLIYIKAGYYTITGPLQLGAIIAGAKIIAIEKWGMPFGCSFQIWDDVMNITVDTKVQGKEKGGDILEGKINLLLIHLLKNCNPKEKKFITQIYQKKRADKTEAEKNQIIKLMEKYGSIEYAEKTAKKYSTQAKNIFTDYAKSLKNTRAKEIIYSCIDFVVNRNR